MKRILWLGCLFLAGSAWGETTLTYLGPADAKKEKMQAAVDALKARVAMFNAKASVELGRDGDAPVAVVRFKEKLEDKHVEAVSFLASTTGKRLEMYAILQDPEPGKWRPGPFENPEKDTAPAGAAWLRTRHISQGSYHVERWADYEDGTGHCYFVKKEPLARDGELELVERGDGEAKYWAAIPSNLALDRIKNAAKAGEKYQGWLVAIDGRAIHDFSWPLTPEDWKKIGEDIKREMKGAARPLMTFEDPKVPEAIAALTKNPLPFALKLKGPSVGPDDGEKK